MAFKLPAGALALSFAAVTASFSLAACERPRSDSAPDVVTSQAESRLFIDPDTGNRRAPTPEERAAMSAPASKAAAAGQHADSAGAEIPLPGGGVLIPLGPEVMSQHRYRRNADGSVSQGGHSDAE
tara:strand:+ start:976 stop:1353 length:378 start_codon:yes stop_codon:yes gene_type:complete